MNLAIELIKVADNTQNSIGPKVLGIPVIVDSLSAVYAAGVSGECGTFGS